MVREQNIKIYKPHNHKITQKNKVYIPANFDMITSCCFKNATVRSASSCLPWRTSISQSVRRQIRRNLFGLRRYVAVLKSINTYVIRDRE